MGEKIFFKRPFLKKKLLVGLSPQCPQAPTALIRTEHKRK